MVQKLRKIMKMKNCEIEMVGKMRSECIEKGLVQVKVRNNSGKVILMFVTVDLKELLRIFS